ncbi:MAG: hypothetical protein QOJ12_2534, partial [Thermoleophilales bacterium]|nr:hypothetical protein [Thermoleophilales bacterium]
MSTRAALFLLALIGLAAVAGPAYALPESSTTLLSRPSGFGPLALGGVNDSWIGTDVGLQYATDRSVSSTGRYVAFVSKADGLSAEDDNRLINVYRRDLVTGTTDLISRASGATGAAADRDSRSPSISADGMRVAFVSTASNLATVANAADQIYVRNLTTNTTTLVSRADGAAGANGSGFSDQPAISGDGTRVAYDTTSLNLDAADTNSRSDVYVRVLATNDTILASRATGAAGAVGDNYSTDAVINSDGTQVAFETDATNLAAADTNASRDIYRRDLTGNATALISRAPGVSGAVGNSFSYDATINGDGTRIAFQSAATNLQAADTDTDRDVYMRDTATATTALISRADGATGANADSTTFDPSIDAAGDTVA